MQIVERKLYQKNKLGNLFVLLYIGLNIVYSIFNINMMPKASELGMFVMSTILLLLVGFLTGTKLTSYSKIWSVVAVILGIFQFVRLTFDVSYLEPNMIFMLNIVLIASGISVIIGGLITYRFSTQRAALLKSNPEKYQSTSH